VGLFGVHVHQHPVGSGSLAAVAGDGAAKCGVHHRGKYSTRGDKDDSREGDRLNVTAGCLTQEIGVMGDEHSPLSRSAVEQNRILELPNPILLCGDNIDAAQAQFGGHCPRDMNIHVEAEAHLEFFKAWSF